MTIEIVRGEEIFSLKERWNELWRHCPEATEAQTWHWQSLYRKHIARGDSLISVTASNGDRLEALGVFSIRRDRKTLQRRLGFFGEHDVDYHGFIFCEGTPESTGKEMLEAVLQAAREAAAVEILNVREGSWTHRVLAHCSFDTLGFTGPRKARVSNCFAIPLPAAIEQYWSALDSKSRERLLNKSKIRKLHRDFKVEFRCSGTRDDMSIVLDEIESVEQLRWGKSNKFGDAPSRNFMREMISTLASDGTCMVFTLYVNERCVAYIAGFNLRGAFRIPYLAHDPTFPGNFSLSLICNVMAIEYCIREGYREYDLTRGSEAYKSLLGGICHRNHNEILYRSAIGERLARLNERVFAPFVYGPMKRWVRKLSRRESNGR